MKVGDNVKIKVGYGRWKAGHEGEIKGHKFESHHRIYDYSVLLDGDSFYSGFDEDELQQERRDEE